MLGMDADRSKVLKQGENYVIEMNYDSRTNATYVESWGYFSDNKTLFIMSMPLDSIRESVGLSNRFITYAVLSCWLPEVFLCILQRTRLQDRF